MASSSWKAGLAGIAVVAATAYAFAQMSHDHPRPHEAVAGSSGVSMQPTLPGQDAFGTIQEIVRILEADPSTDWSKVNIAALREHLIDMNEVTLRANAAQRPIENGVEIVVTGRGRTVAAIKRMVPAHAQELNQLGWKAATQEQKDGVRLTVTGAGAADAAKLRALGFIGIMVQGAHHQVHHLMMAKGAFAH
jgi:antitoxin (DNA-binding transcriptional repressor) of toxin-antitoxin stability system